MAALPSARSSKLTQGSAGRLETVTVSVEDDLAQVTGTSNYDLVKIDVEGFEIEVLHALRNVGAKYLLIEISGIGRQRDYTDGQVHSAILNSFGDYNVLTGSSVSSTLGRV